MTDALRPAGRPLPGIGLRRPGAVGDGRPGAIERGPAGDGSAPAGGTATSTTRPIARATAGARAAEARRPYHLVALLGASAGVYAVSLAAVTGLQASAEQQTAALRAPALETAGRLAAEHDALDGRLAQVRSLLSGRGADYDALAAGLSRYGDGLAGLATAVGAIEGQAAQLPTRIALPSAPRVGSATRPTSVAKTGASGKP